MAAHFQSPNRRAFLQAAVTGAGALSLPITALADETKGSAQPGTFAEPGREIPLHTDADVIVCGAGPAGVSAALTAARAGARTRLFEVHGCLGGVWTAGLLTWIFDFNKPGLTKELTVKLDERGARRGTDAGSFVYEPDEMKLLLEDLSTEAGVKFRLQSRVVAAHKTGNRLTTIVTESKAGREAWQAPVFIDATGDGDVGALAGCGWDVGQSATCPCQPLTMNAMAVVRDVTQMQKFISFYGGDLKWHVKATENFKEEIRRAGFEASYGMPTLFHVRDNVVLVMLNHEYGVLPYDVDAMTSATVRARKEIFKIVRALRQLGGVWDGLQVVATAEQIGVRDGRRIHGRYTVNKQDLLTGARHQDGVARATFGVDIHADTLENNQKETISHGGFRTLPYDIPLRALIAKDVDGLMMAGRCISGDFIAHASYRVTGNAVAMGEAAGVIAALAAASGRLPQDVEWSEGAGKLKQMGQRV
ncbi:FAD-dependent oxidoreductase [Planctomicrobium piriforme]|uniref:FAD dependent oxidoreductase n=1 Tax=Planctomicrobium piriforme TaxID=1576369 RepID=A0A1I3D7M9_9PLAN|nr:FAD-dependent oxidoreductase [Planctomicrobium piriforme]SFH82521.1 FAD dependent oxidoreductase [Planctomicrobium piriforme]